MSETIRYEARLFLLSIATGAGLLLVYDFLRIFRLFVRHKSWIVGAEDLLYGVYCSCMTFSLLYEQNDGNLRGYVIAGVAAGMIIFQNLVSRKVLKYLQNAIAWLKIKSKKYRHRSEQVRR